MQTLTAHCFSRIKLGFVKYWDNHHSINGNKIINICSCFLHKNKLKSAETLIVGVSQIINFVLCLLLKNSAKILTQKLKSKIPKISFISIDIIPDINIPT